MGKHALKKLFLHSKSIKQKISACTGVSVGGNLLYWPHYTNNGVVQPRERYMCDFYVYGKSNPPWPLPAIGIKYFVEICEFQSLLFYVSTINGDVIWPIKNYLQTLNIFYWCSFNPAIQRKCCAIKLAMHLHKKKMNYAVLFVSCNNRGIWV